MTGPFQKWNLPRAILGTILLATLVVLFGLWLHNAWKTGNETLSEELAKLDRLRSIAAYKTELETLDTGPGDKIYGDLFLKEGTAAVVSADLLAQLKQMAAARSVEVIRVGDLQPKAEGPITLIGGSLEMSGSVTGIYDLVREIETVKPLLFVDRLDIRSNTVAGVGDTSETRLVAQMHVYGAVRSRTPKKVGATDED
jgi:Tfp pilus assembly protein PilO